MWTDETEASLRKWVSEGYSFSKIAEMMRAKHGFAVSRNACTGKAWRLEIAQPDKKKPVLRSGAQKPAVFGRASARRHDGHTPHSTKSTEPYKIAPQPIVEVVFDAPHGAAEAVTALHPDQCRYPIGEPADPDFHFCHAKQRDGSVYCEAHHKRCTQPYERKGIRRGADKPSGAMQGWA